MELARNEPDAIQLGGVLLHASCDMVGAQKSPFCDASLLREGMILNYLEPNHAQGHILSGFIRIYAIGRWLNWPWKIYVLDWQEK